MFSGDGYGSLIGNLGRFRTHKLTYGSCALVRQEHFFEGLPAVSVVAGFEDTEYLPARA